MPRLDGTGPNGQGPKTGRGLGTCGAGLRRGCGCGLRRFFSPKNYISTLEEEEKMLEEELAAVKKEKEALKDQQN